MELNEQEINDLNFICHQKEWSSVLKLFKIYEDNTVSKITTSSLTNDELRESIGELRVYKGLATLVFSTHERLKKTEVS